MTTATIPGGPPRTIGFAHVLRSELTKLRSVRSTYWTAAGAATATLAVCIIVCLQWRSNLLSGKGSAQGFDPTLTSLNGLYLAQLAFGSGQIILSGASASASLTDPTVLRAATGGGLYLTAVGLLGFGLGALIRHTAGALSALFGLLFASTALVDLLPTSWRNNLIDYMPLNAGSQILTTVRTSSALGPWTGLGVLSLYAAAAITAAAVLITRRDV